MKTKFSIVIYISILCLLMACAPQKEHTQEQESIASIPSKLEQFLQLPTDSVYAICDLSNDSITDFPDFSAYTIRKLDLSHNQIDLLVDEFFPKEMRVLDISHNDLGQVDFKSFNDECLQELNLSYNRIVSADIWYDTQRIIVSRNNLRFIRLYASTTRFLDISNNPNLSNIFHFNPWEIDTILRNNIANNNRLTSIFENDIMEYETITP